MPADYRRDYWVHATALSDHLLSDYDSRVPPPSNRSVGYSEAGTDVGVELLFYKIESLAISNGLMKLKCWLRLKWTDERLSWDPSEWGNLTQVFMRGSSYSDPETSDIWLPDVTAYSALAGFMSSFDPAFATATSSGVVSWSRAGMLELMCRYSGLMNFPDDKLVCSFEIGGWLLGGGKPAAWPWARLAGTT